MFPHYQGLLSSPYWKWQPPSPALHNPLTLAHRSPQCLSSSVWCIINSSVNIFIVQLPSTEYKLVEGMGIVLSVSFTAVYLAPGIATAHRKPVFAEWMSFPTNQSINQLHMNPYYLSSLLLSLLLQWILFPSPTQGLSTWNYLHSPAQQSLPPPL